MSYLSIANFWKYQNADVWKKSPGHPPWFKHYVHRDRELDKLEPMARLLFYELLGAATRHKNVLDSDPKWLLTETLLDTKDIANHLPALLNGGWIKASATPKRSRMPSRVTRESLATYKKKSKKEDTPPSPPQKGDALTLREAGENPRALVTARKRHNVLADFVRRYWDEYPDEQILVDELTDRGCRRDEAEDLVAAERTKRTKEAEAA